jgi:hypothetical protein
MKASRIALAVFLIFVLVGFVFAQDAAAQQAAAPAGPTTWQIILNIIVSLILSIPDKLAWCVMLFFAIKWAVMAGRRAELTGYKALVEDVAEYVKRGGKRGLQQDQHPELRGIPVTEAGR